jgi:hypothetical protein
LAASENGHSVLSEDGVTIDADDERSRIWPGLGGVRAAVRGRKGFVELAPERQAREPLPLAAICVLGERGERLDFTPLSPTAAVPALVPSLIHSGEPMALARSFGLLARVLARVPAYRVSLPDDLALVGPSARSLLEQLAL